MSRFSVEMAKFRDHVNFVRNGLGCSKTDLAVNLMRFELKKTRLTIFCADKEVFCWTKMQVRETEEEESSLSFTVLGPRIEKLISQVEAEILEFNVDPENVEIRAGFLVVNFEQYDGSGLQAVESGALGEKEVEGLPVLKPILEEALVCAKACATQTSIRPDITHVEVREGTCLSSDGRKIMIYESEAIPSALKFKIPGSSLNSVVSSVKNMDCEHIQVKESKSYYILEGGLKEFIIGMRKVERIFPPVSAEFNKAKQKEEVAIDKNVLEAMLKGVALGLPSDEVGVQFKVTGSGKEAMTQISSKNSVGRLSYERASCGRKGTEADVEVPISFKHLLDSVGVFKGDSVVDLVLNLDISVMVVMDKTEERTVKTIIPFRTAKAVEEEAKEKDELKKAKQKIEETGDVDPAEDAIDEI